LRIDRHRRSSLSSTGSKAELLWKQTLTLRSENRRLRTQVIELLLCCEALRQPNDRCLAADVIRELR
jgi:hypothetical protein